VQFSVAHTAPFFEAVEAFLNDHTPVLIVTEEQQPVGILPREKVQHAIVSGSYKTATIAALMEPYDEAEVATLPLQITTDAQGCITSIAYRQHGLIPVSEPYLGENEWRFVLDAMLSTWIANTGHYVNQFEKEFADFCGTKHAVTVTNGSDAIIVALRALSVKSGDEVILPDATFAAVINAPLHIGAIPVVVDVDADSWCMSAATIAPAITANTKAIIVVHGFGQACDMDPIMDLAAKHNLFVIEDCAEAHGACYKGKKIGSMGHIGTFSFFANKIMTSGEGGICTTNDKTLDEAMRVLKNHGMRSIPGKRYWFEVEGYNARMTNIQCAIALGQLRRIDTLIERLKELDHLYRQAMQNIPGIRFQRMDIAHCEPVVWFPTIVFERGNREEFIEKARAELGVDIRQMTTAFSEVPIYQRYIFSSGIGLQISNQAAHLPTAPQVTSEVIEAIAACLKQYMAGV
jgi:perosamine synthetase